MVESFRVPGMAETASFLTCPLCEATCGLEVTLRDGAVERIRGDADDVFSKGFLCPKGVSIRAPRGAPARRREPMRKQPDGTFAPVSWDEAFEEIDARLMPIARESRDAAAVYIGNPSAHNLATMLYGRVFLKALGSKNIYSASTVDQYPKQLA